MASQESEESDCMDDNKGLVERIKDCMGGEAAGVDERDG